MLQKMKVFTIDAMSSNSMKSRNPYSGIHETYTSKCLDTMCLDPSCNQGGHMIVIALEGNGARPSHMGKGFNEDGSMYTLNTIEQHSVCYKTNNEILCYDGQSCGTYTKATSPVQASRADDHHIPAVCFRKGV